MQEDGMAQGSARIGKDRYRTEIDVGGPAPTCGQPPPPRGGRGWPAPPRPALASLGACTAITLRMYADRKGWPLESVEVGLRLSGREEKRIDRSLAIVGLDDEQRARMADIAERTPVTLTLKAGLPITTTLA